MRAALVSTAVLAACAVPDVSLEGKQCPCIEVGYVCDQITNRCLATNDGGGIIDSPSATSCLTAPAAEVELYRYDGTFDWQHADSSWTGATEILQASTNAQNSYAYKTTADLTAAPDVHVISTMREIKGGAGEPALGIVLRAQLSLQTKERYACMWNSKARTLSLQVAQGGNLMTLQSVAVPGMEPLPKTVTMEASVTGSTLACCIREIADAKLADVVDTLVTAGYPGLQTHRMQAAFGSFVVLRPN